jgi:hypothetical protein
MLDANVPINSKEQNVIQELMDQCNLVNLYKEILDNDKESATLINNSQTIEFMVCTPNHVEHIWKMGYIPFYECYDSNHRGIYCNISNSVFKESKSKDITKKKD